MKALESSIKDLKVGNNEYIKKIKIMSKRIIVLYGLNGAGKDSIKDQLVQNDIFLYNIKSTSRKIKSNEIDGVDYHYIEQEQLKDSLNYAIVSYSYLSNYYWDDAREVFRNLKNNPKKYIILIMGNIIGFKEFIKVLPNVNKFCIIATDNENEQFNELKQRMVNRKKDKIEEIEERLKVSIDSSYELKAVADKVIVNRRGQLHDTVNEIIIYLNEQNNGLTI